MAARVGVTIRVDGLVADPLEQHAALDAGRDRLQQAGTDRDGPRRRAGTDRADRRPARPRLDDEHEALGQVLRGVDARIVRVITGLRLPRAGVDLRDRQELRRPWDVVGDRRDQSVEVARLHVRDQQRSRVAQPDAVIDAGADDQPPADQEPALATRVVLGVGDEAHGGST